MKVKVDIELDMETGEYDIQIFSKNKSKKKIDQQKLARNLQKVIESWNMRFTN